MTGLHQLSRYSFFVRSSPLYYYILRILTLFFGGTRAASFDSGTSGVEGHRGRRRTTAIAERPATHGLTTATLMNPGHHINLMNGCASAPNRTTLN
jgi:hypothetical protein